VAHFEPGFNGWAAAGGPVEGAPAGGAPPPKGAKH
jgi:hypothetical protein